MTAASTGFRHARRSAWVRAALLAALAASALAASSFVPPNEIARAAVPIDPSMRRQISTMSTGIDQPIVVTGASALARNALIPTSGLPAGRMRGFAEIDPGSEAYSTALKCMTQAIYYEAANEPEAGKRGVAQVVLNRLRHPAYPNSVCEVVYEGANARVCQFSFTCDGSLMRAPMARQWSEARRIAAEALAGVTEPSVGSATNYHADYVVPRWAFTLAKLTQIGRHIFYRLPGRIGTAAAFGDRWSGAERIPALDYGRLRGMMDGRSSAPAALPTDETLVPGLTVAPDVRDRHAERDIGGRLDTTTTWRMTIPDPVALSSSYQSAIAGQSGTELGAAPTP